MDKIIGVRVNSAGEPDPPENELDNFYTCNVCGQSVDKRDLYQVFYHEEPEHEPTSLVS